MFRTRKQDSNFRAERTLDRNMIKVKRRAQAVGQQEPITGGRDEAQDLSDIRKSMSTSFIVPLSYNLNEPVIFVSCLFCLQFGISLVGTGHRTRILSINCSDLGLG